jgi:YgiT-type zinc finger domain-containing protein
MNNKAFHTCPRCQIGHLQREKATFTALLDDHLLSIAGVTSWKCDICQFQEFDRHALAQIEQVTGSLYIDEQTTRPSSRSLSSDFVEQDATARLKP